MSTAYAYNVGLGLNFSGQEEGEQLDVEMNGLPQDSTYSSHSQDYTASPVITSSPNGQFFVPRMSRSEGNPTPSPQMQADGSYLSPRVNYGMPSKAAMRFQSVRSHSPGMMLSPAAYSPYAQSSQFCASPALFNQTPLASPLQSEYNHSDSYPYFNSPHMSAASDGFQSTYASPLLLQHQQPNQYYGHSPLVSPPITPMDGSSTFAHQMSSTPVKIEIQDRSFEYPMSPYTPTYASHPHNLGLDESDTSRRPVSAGRLIAQRDIYSNDIVTNHPLKRAHSFNSTRFAKSLSPPRSVSSSSQSAGSKRPTYSKWTAEEDDMLRTAIAIHGTSKWSLVASMVKGRTAMQCSTRWQGALNTTIHKGKWEAEEDRILVTAVEKWREEHPPQSPGYDSDDDEQGETIPWGMIASMLPRRRTGIQCQARWSEALDPTVRKGKWTPEEDEMLFKGVAEHGQCWIKVASKVKGRTQRQIRTRWMQIRGRDKGLKVNQIMDI